MPDKNHLIRTEDDWSKMKRRLRESLYVWYTDCCVTFKRLSFVSEKERENNSESSD